MSQVVESPCPKCAEGRRQQTWLLVGAVAIIGVFTVLVYGLRGNKSQAGTDQERSSQWVEKLKDRDFDTRRSAARELLALGKDASPYAAEIEAALKDAAWDFATTVVPELGTNAEATFQVVGSKIAQPSPEEVDGRPG